MKKADLRLLAGRLFMEAAGIEPASCELLAEASTCVVGRLSLARGGTADRAASGPGHHVSRPGRSDR